MTKKQTIYEAVALERVRQERNFEAYQREKDENERKCRNIAEDEARRFLDSLPVEIPWERVKVRPDGVVCNGPDFMTGVGIFIFPDEVPTDAQWDDAGEMEGIPSVYCYLEWHKASGMYRLSKGPNGNGPSYHVQSSRFAGREGDVVAALTAAMYGLKLPFTREKDRLVDLWKQAQEWKAEAERMAGVEVELTIHLHRATPELKKAAKDTSGFKKGVNCWQCAFGGYSSEVVVYMPKEEL